MSDYIYLYLYMKLVKWYSNGLVILFRIVYIVYGFLCLRYVFVIKIILLFFEFLVFFKLNIIIIYSY